MAKNLAKRLVFSILFDDCEIIGDPWTCWVITEEEHEDWHLFIPNPDYNTWADCEMVGIIKVNESATRAEVEKAVIDYANREFKNFYENL